MANECYAFKSLSYHLRVDWLDAHNERVHINFYIIHVYDIMNHTDVKWERADLLVQLCTMFLCVFVTFPYGVSSQVWNLIHVVPIPDLCRLLVSYQT